MIPGPLALSIFWLCMSHQQHGDMHPSHFEPGFESCATLLPEVKVAAFAEDERQRQRNILEDRQTLRELTTMLRNAQKRHPK